MEDRISYNDGVRVDTDVSLRRMLVDTIGSAMLFPVRLASNAFNHPSPEALDQLGANPDDIEASQTAPGFSPEPIKR